MTAYIGAVTRIEGALVYRDHKDYNQFYYIPQNISLQYGDNLKEFKVDYWGIGAPYRVQDSSGKVRSSVGAIMSGKAAFDISEAQRKIVIDGIKSQFGAQNPRLAPMRLTDVAVKPVFAKNTMGFGSGSDIDFPESIQFGETRNFTIGTGNSLFANIVASEANSGPQDTANPTFGINLVGMAEVRGEPWEASVEVECSLFWEYVRKKVSASVNWGWFSLGEAEFSSVFQDLQKDKKIKISFSEGSLDLAKFGSQIFEMGRQVAEKINSDGGGEFFKFEPVPQRSLYSYPRIMGIFGGLGVSVNASYTSESYRQKTTFKETISYTGNFKIPVGSSMSLAVSCSAATKQLFNELASPEPCLTSAKATAFQTRLAADAAKKQERVALYLKMLADGKIDFPTYDKLVERLNSTSIEDGAFMTSRPPLLNAAPEELLRGGQERALTDADLDEEDIAILRDLSEKRLSLLNKKK